jgi:hypothetical protein
VRRGASSAVTVSRQYARRPRCCASSFGMKSSGFDRRSPTSASQAAGYGTSRLTRPRSTCRLRPKAAKAAACSR